MQRGTTLYQDRITVDPDILVGKPVVRGTRIPVELVLEKLAETPDLRELFADYPRLTREDVQACLAYATRLVQGTSRRMGERERAAQPRGR